MFEISFRIAWAFRRVWLLICYMTLRTTRVNALQINNWQYIGLFSANHNKYKLFNMNLLLHKQVQLHRQPNLQLRRLHRHPHFHQLEPSLPRHYQLGLRLLLWLSVSDSLRHNSLSSVSLLPRTPAKVNFVQRNVLGYIQYLTDYLDELILILIHWSLLSAFWL